MKKLLISLIAIVATIGSSVAADCCNNGCKPKKYRIIHISATNPDSMYGDATYSDMILGNDAAPEYHMDEYDSEPLSITRDWYIGGRVGLHLMSWKNKYKGSPSNYKFDESENHDNYVFEPVFGGGIFAGYHFAPNWRGDIEFGYMTRFDDSDNGFTFKLSTPYITGNAYYDFASGFYLGAGVGLAFPRATMDYEYFTPDSESETKLSFMGALMAGYSYNLSESVALDFRYRLAGFTGPKWTRDIVSPSPIMDENGVSLTSLETRVGFIIDNSLSLGLRYEF